VPFLDSEHVQRLREVYFAHHREAEVRARTIPSYAPGFYASTFNNDADYRRTVSAAVEERVPRRWRGCSTRSRFSTPAFS
jgi:hypothetical protein